MFRFSLPFQAGCEAHLDRLATGMGVEGGLGGLLAHLCSVMLTEAHEISQAGFPEHRRDLFMEQGINGKERK